MLPTLPIIQVMFIVTGYDKDGRTAKGTIKLKFADGSLSPSINATLVDIRRLANEMTDNEWKALQDAFKFPEVWFKVEGK